MPDHSVQSAYYDEDWCVVCSCGECFYATYRPEAAARQRRHAGLAGVAGARVELERGGE